MPFLQRVKEIGDEWSTAGWRELGLESRPPARFIGIYPHQTRKTLDLIHPEQFRRCVRRYRGEYKVKHFSCWDQFLCMAFGQITFRDSLRDIEVCLRSRQEQLYHMGLRSHVSHSTLADANKSRDWRIYADLAQSLIRRARLLYQNEPIGIELKEAVYALDSTTIDLCISLFPWARFRRRKAAVKLHTLLDIRGSIPTFIAISEAKQADVRVLDELILEPGSFYVMDRAYVDFLRLYRFVLASAFFVTRSKKGIQFQRMESRPVDHLCGIRFDHIVRLKTKLSENIILTNFDAFATSTKKLVRT